MRNSKDVLNSVLARARQASLRASLILIFFFSFCFLFFLLFSQSSFAATEVLTATDWTSSQTITDEGLAYGVFNGSAAIFNNFGGTAQQATAAVISNFVGPGTYNNASFEIRMSSDGSISDDSLAIEYYDGTSWYQVVSGVQPGTGLTTYGPYDMIQTTTSGEVDAAQVRIVWTKEKGPDNTDINIDGVEITVDYDASDLTAPDVNLTSPGNDTWDLDGSVTFSYDVYDVSDLVNCSLYINNTFNQSNSTPITNGGSNSFSQSLADGVYFWNVQCYDAATANNEGWGDNNFTIKIDTAYPIVNLENPEDGNYTEESSVTFYWNASDAQTTLDSCELVVNDSVKESWTTPAEDTSISSLQSFLNGYYEWWVNCTDANGFETKSEVRNFTVNTTLPTIAPDKGSYLLGETVIVDGANWNALVNITLNYQLSNGTNYTYNVTTDGAGEFIDNFFLNYSFPDGTYNLDAYQWNDVSENASTSWIVNNLTTTLSAVPLSTPQGDEMTFSGTGYSPNSQVNITISYTNGTNESFLTTADGAGAFGVNYNLSYNSPLGLTNVSSWDNIFLNLDAYNNFTIYLRVAELTVNDTTYERDSDVFINGTNFTRYGTVELHIYDNLTNASASGFPLNKTAGNYGDFWQIWNTGDTCNGIYAVEAWDQNQTFLNDTTYFTIDETIANQDEVPTTAGFKGIGAGRTALNISLVDSSNDQWESQASLTKTTWYYEFNFSNSYNRGLQVSNVDFVLEHYDGGGFSNPQLFWWNSSLAGWQSIGCPSLSTGATEHNDTCDITSAYNTPVNLDTVEMRVEFTKTGGGSSSWSVDYARLLIDTEYEPACTYLNGSSGGGLADNPPVVQTVLLEDDLTAIADELDLNAGTTKTVFCNVTASDNDGYLEITGVNATIYSSTVFESSADDPRNHYTNDTCEFITGAGTTADYSCTFQVEYYAINGTWTCGAYATDGTDVDSDSDVSTMNPLYAVNINTTMINYGEVPLAGYSSDQVANVSNYGNMQINVTTYAYGATGGDGLSFVCDTSNLLLSSERFALNPGVAFAAKTVVTSGLSPIGLLITAQTTSTLSQNETYWQVYVDPATAPAGNCTGTVVFQADAP